MDNLQKAAYTIALLSCISKISNFFKHEKYKL